MRLWPKRRRLPLGLRGAAGLTGEAERPYDFTQPRPCAAPRRPLPMIGR